MQFIDFFFCNMFIVGKNGGPKKPHKTQRVIKCKKSKTLLTKTLPRSTSVDVDAFMGNTEMDKLPSKIKFFRLML